MEDVVEKLRQLKPDKSPDINQAHLYVLRECCEEMAHPLSMIWSLRSPWMKVTFWKIGKWHESYQGPKTRLETTDQ